MFFKSRESTKKLDANKKNYLLCISSDDSEPEEDDDIEDPIKNAVTAGYVKNEQTQNHFR